MKLSKLLPKNKPRVFICYRREDSGGYAGRIAADLERRFGQNQVFIDVRTLEGGDDFVEKIERFVSSCDVFIAVIGKRWLTISDGETRKLEKPNDFVRLEITSALKREIPIIPVLVQGANHPSQQDLPPELEALARRQAIEISDTRWEYDVKRLINSIEAVLPEQPIAWKKVSLISGCIALLLLGFIMRESLIQYLTPSTLKTDTENYNRIKGPDSASENQNASNVRSNPTEVDPPPATSNLSDPGRKRIRPIQSGSSFSHEKVTGGNICCVVKDENNAAYLLSSNDVFVAVGAKPGDSILQPGTHYGGKIAVDKVATLTKWLSASRGSSITVVGALARIADETKWSPEILGFGQIKGIHEIVKQGDEVLVVGYQGTLKRVVTKPETNLVINWTDPKSVLEGVIAIDEPDPAQRKPPSASNDWGGYSGAAVVTKNGYLVGMVVDFRSVLHINGAVGTEIYVIPIQRILKRLEVELVL